MRKSISKCTIICVWRVSLCETVFPGAKNESPAMWFAPATFNAVIRLPYPSQHVETGCGEARGGKSHTHTNIFTETRSHRCVHAFKNCSYVSTRFNTTMKTKRCLYVLHKCKRANVFYIFVSVYVWLHGCC